MVGTRSNNKMGALLDVDAQDDDQPSSQEIRKVRTPTPTRSSPKKKELKKTVKNTKPSKFFDENNDSDSQNDFQSEQSSTSDSESEQGSQQSRQVKEVIVLESSDDDKKLHEQVKKRARSEPTKTLSTRRAKTSAQPVKLQITPPSSSLSPSNVANQTISNNQMDEESNKENIENYSTPKIDKTKKQSSSNSNNAKKLSLKPDSKNEYVLVPLIPENNTNNNENSTFSKSSPSKRPHEELESDEEQKPAPSPSPAPSTPTIKISKLEADIGETTPVAKKTKTSSKPPSIKTVRKEAKSSSKTSKSSSKPDTTPLQSTKKSGWKKKKEEEENNNNNNASSESMDTAISPSIAKSKRKYTKKSPSTASQNDNSNTSNNNNNNNTTSSTHTDSNGNEIARMLQNLPADQVQAVRPPTRHPKSWEDVARFARVDFSKPSTPKPNKYSLSPGTPLSPIAEPVGSPDPNKKKKKKGRVQAALNLPQKVPSLQTLCVELVCKYIDCVESFGTLPPGVQNCLSMTLAKHRTLNATSLKLFLDAGVTELSLTNCAELDPPSLQLIATCPDLDTISLTQCGRLNDETLSAIAQGCPNLKSIELNGSYQVSDASLCEMVASHPKIFKLKLHWIHRFSIEFAKKLAENCPEISELHFAKCTQIDDSILQQLQGFKNLQIFTLDEAPLVTDDGIASFLQNAAQTLTSVTISRCEKITEKGLSALAACSGLTSLHLNGFEKLTDDGVFTFMEGKNLRNLTMQECPHITDKSVSVILKQTALALEHLNLQNLQISEESTKMLCSCSKLEVLNLSWCRGIDDFGIDSVMKGCHKLKKIALWGCTQVSDIVVSNFIAKGIEVIGKDQFLVQPQ